jgi:beta-glucuronidase
MRHLPFLLLPILAGAPLGAQLEKLIVNVDHRKTVSLDGAWQAIVDPFETGYYSYRYLPREDGFFLDRKPRDKRDRVEYDFDASDSLDVPGDWNSQREKLFLYEGSVWYRKIFRYEPRSESRLFVYFGAANYQARVYLNGEALGAHEGGFTPFSFEITGQVREGENTLIVQVDNRRRREGVPTVNTDWWNYGGLTRRVLLVEVPRTFVRDYLVQLRRGSRDEIEGWIQLDGTDLRQAVVIRLPSSGIEHAVTTDENGFASFRFSSELPLWSPQNPVLHDVSIAAETDEIRERIGFRTIETRGDEILLNGRTVFLRGISLHEEAPLRGGRAFGTEDARILLGWARELGCNFVRLAHYPHNEAMIRAADELGVMLWSEIPVYWTILWDNPETFELASQQLEEMITRDKNRAAVVLWSVANETPRGASRLSFLTRLIEKARNLDPTRLITAATELGWKGTALLLDDPLGEYLDVLGANEYVGWYGGTPEDALELTWKSRYEKPLIVSELGGGALAGHHGDAETRWTEEYQENLYLRQIAMLEKIPFLRGMSPWILTDFRSPRRLLPGIQDYWNRKGLISDDGQRKKAFFVLQRQSSSGTTASWSPAI